MRTRGVTHVFLEVSSHALDLRRVDRRRLRRRGLHQPLPGPPGLPPGPGRLFCRQIPALSGNPGQRRRLPGPGGPQPGRPPGATSSQTPVRVPALTYGLPSRKPGAAPELPLPPGRPRGPCSPPRRGKWRSPPAWWGPSTWPISWRPRPRPWAWGLTRTPWPGASRRLPGVPGRLERFGPPAGPGVFVDYAHTPAAITQALAALQHPQFFPDHHGVRLRRRPGPQQTAPHGRRPRRRGRNWSSSPATIPAPKTPWPLSGRSNPGLSTAACPRSPRPRPKAARPGYLVVPDRREAIRLAVALARPGRGGPGGRQRPRKLSDLGGRAPPLRRPGRSGPGPEG